MKDAMIRVNGRLCLLFRTAWIGSGVERRASCVVRRFKDTLHLDIKNTG